MKFARSLGSSIFLLALLATACGTPHRPRGADNPGLVLGRLAEKNPLDIAVLPVTNATGRGDVPLDQIRREFAAGLVGLRYSPLALDYVDRRAVEASYEPGSLAEHALLRVSITRWDDTHWRSHGRIAVEGDVALTDAASLAAPALWGGHVARQVELGLARDVIATDADRRAEAVRRFVQGVLASLPARDPTKPVGTP